jgi:hypothetical protein
MFSHVISYCATSIKKHFNEMDLKVSISVVVRLCFLLFLSCIHDNAIVLALHVCTRSCLQFNSVS